MRKTLISIALAALALAACKKEGDVQPEKSTAVRPPIALRPTVNTGNAKQDTIPDNAGIRIRLAKDSLTGDETMIIFDHTASINYSAVNDALYFPGFGKISLCSISGDGKNVAINTLPYKTGMCVDLNVNTKTDGDYSLSLSYAKAIPADLHPWIRDAYAKDSVDFSAGSYNFKVLKADANSFGSKRFSLVFKQVQQTAHN